MEAVEEHIHLNTTVDVVKPNLVEEASTEEPNVCHKSNGVDCVLNAEEDHSEAISLPSESITTDIQSEKSENVNNEIVSESTATPVAVSMDNVEITADQPDSVTEIEVEHISEISNIVETAEIVPETVIESAGKEICIEEEIITEPIVEVESSISTVHFETEIVVEESDNNVTEKLLDENQECCQPNNILNELGSNLELSEVLRSSDTNDNAENNNSSQKQEIFNKEELLEILEGNDVEHPGNQNIETSPQISNKISSAEIAMQQLSRLTSKKKKVEGRTSKTKKGEKNKSPVKDGTNIGGNKIVKEKKQHSHLDEGEKIELDTKQQKADDENSKQDSERDTYQQPMLDTGILNSDSIVKSLVMDWEDEPTENNEANEIIKLGENLIKDTEELKSSQESLISQEDSVDSPLTLPVAAETQGKLNNIGDDGPTRRLGRVIKKKVIFDPDNPDTFTKSKTSKPKELLATKEHIPSKKPKLEQILQRSKSKSPIPKLQWKKPSPRNSKQCKRLSEVDKLLMDEGAVNMIYQLTPEAPKGKKNVRTKAEFIKKIQSSTPDGKEMKFRERKKESIKYEDGEAKRILAGKQRISLSSSVKSPSVSEDFETHSADDSIIYRRHSSSSYSSSCMSPRRLSDVEVGSTQNVARITQHPLSYVQNDSTLSLTGETVFIPKKTSSEMINKNDCLSIKEKLNSKLSLALNKRKRDNYKSDKPAKQKKLIKVEVEVDTSLTDQERLNKFKFISISFDQRLAIICIKKTGLKICVEILKELEEALDYIDSKKDTSITLLESQCGTLCSSLDLSLLLDENKEIRANNAYDLAESVRLLLSSVVRHSKLVCCGVWGACAGVALALVALSDVVLASEGASFWLAASAAPVLPGAAALTARCKALPQALVNDLVIFGRRLSASEALQGGLISRVLWPDRFDEQVQNIAKDIAAQPMENILLKKRLLRLKNNTESDHSFLSCLEAERDLLVDYWTSVEGQELLRATLDPA